MNIAKKILLSLSVIIIFIAYSFQQRRGTTLVIAPSHAADNSSNSSGVINLDDGSSSTAASQPTTTTQTSGKYKDGSYTGSVADAFYGNIQVEVVVSGGKITDVKFLQYPNDRQNSIYINSQAMPYLKQEAIKAQSANVNGVTGATDTSLAFIQSLTDALSKAGG